MDHSVRPAAARSEHRHAGFVYQTSIRTSPEQRWRALTDPDQVVIESDPCRRLTYSWHSYTPDWAEASGIDEALRAVLAAERRTTVTFVIEDLGEAVKLTVLHSNFEARGAAATTVREGWPRVISDLKSLLETGDPLPVS